MEAERTYLKNGSPAWVGKHWSPPEREAKIALLEKLNEEKLQSERLTFVIIGMIAGVGLPLLILGVIRIVSWLVRGFASAAR
jgi:hypothetical protein